jgi:hypothetical protein
MRSLITNSLLVLVTVVSLIYCKTTNYYDEIKKDCNHKRAVQIFEKMQNSNDPAIYQVINAMADCKNEVMDEYLSSMYSRSSDMVKNQIYTALTRNKSKVFLNTIVDIIINRAQTNQNYSDELNYINGIDRDFLKKRYRDYKETIERLKREKNYVALDLYLDKARTLSRIIGEEMDEEGLRDEMKSMKSEREREELYNKFIEATNNQNMERAYNIFMKMKSLGYVNNSEKATRLEGILKEISDIEQRFYETARKQDNLMIEIEKLKRENKTLESKRLQSELNSVKSDMVFKKRALDRAAKKLVIARELIEEVIVK